MQYAVVAQDANLSYKNLQNAIPPSPDASAIGKYGEVEVSKYTGVPQISVPIYTISENGIQIPVSLNYHSGGIKVEEHSGWTGLGWSLSAGGIVSRSVVGLADDEIGGYLTQPYNLEQFHLLSSQTQQAIFKSSSEGDLDLEPDIYSFSFLNYSGKFLINKATRTGIPVSKNTMKIEILGNTIITGWKITDRSGIVFYFQSSERTSIKSYGAYNRGEYVRQDYTSSWHLTKIVLLSGQEINFTYQSYINEYYNRQGASKYIFIGGGTDQYTCTNSSNDLEKYSTFRITGNRLHLVQFSNGTLKFNPSLDLRQDMPNDYCLNSIELFNRENVRIKNFKLVYDYFQSNQMLSQSSSGILFNDGFKKRLKLIAFKEIGSDLKELVTSFEYLPGELPSIYSNSQDHWGFFNGRNNSSLIPLDVTTGLGSTGVDRAVDFNYAKVGTLNKIIYPTGGYTVFEYESNEARISERDYLSNFYPYGPTSAQYQQTYGINVSNPSELTKDIFIDTKTIKIDASSNFYYFIDLNDPINCSGTNRDCIGALRVTLTCLDCNSQNGGAGISYSLMSGDFVNGVCSGKVWLIPEKNYRLSIVSLGDFASVSAQIYGTKEVLPAGDTSRNVNMQVGGLRIKNIKSYVANDVVSKKTNYLYTSRTNASADSGTIYESSGVMVTYPHYNSLKLFIQKSQSMSTYFECYYKLMSSSSNIPLGGNSGLSVGYADVQTILETPLEKIKTISSFVTANDIPDFCNYEFPYVIELSRDNSRGDLKKEIQYRFKNGQYSIAHELENQYEIPSNYNSYSYGIRFGIKVYYPAVFMNSEFAWQTYQHLSEWKCLKSTITKEYAENITTPLTKKIDYFFDNPISFESTRTEHLDSKGLALTTITRTPLDKTAIHALTPLNSTALQALDSMIARNMHSPVIQQVQYRNNTLSELKLANYKLWSNNIAAIENIQAKITTNPLETRLQFTKYDAKGNLVEQQKANDVKEVYLYGYNSMYPVAKILNSTYDIAKTYVNQSILDNPSDDVTLRNHLNSLRSISGALVTTFTYKPLVGMTSQTDANGRTTYYSYDAFNRLQLIKDQDGNIIKKICYNYQGQQTNCESTITYSSAGIDNYYYSQSCPSGQTAQPYYVNVPAGMFTSTISQVNANTQAQQYAQSQANQYGNCQANDFPLYCNNSAGVYCYVELYNVNTGQSYWFTSYGYNGILGYIPEGTYNIYVSASNNYNYFSGGAGCYYYTYGYGNLSFYNVPLNPSCNIIDIY